MSDRLLAIISTAERGKAQTGLMYSLNALKHGWMEDVKLFFFGPAQALLLEDEQLQQWVKEFQALEEPVTACKFIADNEGTDKQIAELGVDVQYVGTMISDLIKQGYTPMVW